VDVLAPLLADGQPAVASDPRQRALDDPPVSAEPPAGVYPALDDAGGDVLPVRVKLGEGDAWQIGLNHLATDEPRWYTLADFVASTILTRKPPRVLRAVRLVASETQLEGLRPVRLRGAVGVDPAAEDFFRVVIELRKAPPGDLAPPAARCRPRWPTVPAVNSRCAQSTPHASRVRTPSTVFPGQPVTSSPAARTA